MVYHLRYPFMAIRIPKTAITIIKIPKPKIKPQCGSPLTLAALLISAPTKMANIYKIPNASESFPHCSFHLLFL